MTGLRLGAPANCAPCRRVSRAHAKRPACRAMRWRTVLLAALVQFARRRSTFQRPFLRPTTRTASSICLSHPRPGPTTPPRAALRAGATLTLTLHGDAWADGIGDDNAPTEALLAALRGASLRSPVAAPFRPFGWAGAEPRGWNATVAPLLDRTRLSVSGASLAIALPALPCFDLHAPEVLVAHLPAAAIASQRPISTPSLHIRADPTISPPRWGSVSAPPAEVGRSCTQVHLRWAAPHHMGGSPLAHYVLETRRDDDGGDGAWSAGDPLAAPNGSVALAHGGRYAVRVRAYAVGHDASCAPLAGDVGGRRPPRRVARDGPRGGGRAADGRPHRRRRRRQRDGLLPHGRGGRELQMGRRRRRADDARPRRRRRRHLPRLRRRTRRRRRRRRPPHALPPPGRPTRRRRTATAGCGTSTTR